MKRDLEKLVALARKAREFAYAPYSRYPVGAAVLARSGKVYSGCNIENAAYPTGVCAERVAIFKAVSEGEHDLVALAVVTSNGGSPCGACRQAFSEFAPEDAIIVLAPQRGSKRRKWTMKQILPDRFGPGQLK